MNWIRISMLGIFVVPTLGLGSVWTASCQNLEFSFDRETKQAVVYFRGAKGLFAVASGPVVFDNGTAVRAELPLTGAAEKQNAAQVGLNISREIVYLVARHSQPGKPKDTVFCETPISTKP